MNHFKEGIQKWIQKENTQNEIWSFRTLIRLAGTILTDINEEWLTGSATSTNARK